MPNKRIKDYDEAVEVAPGIYWVGFYDKKARLHCNPYVIIDTSGEAILIDPGSSFRIKCCGMATCTLFSS